MFAFRVSGVLVQAGVLCGCLGICLPARCQPINPRTDLPAPADPLRDEEEVADDTPTALPGLSVEFTDFQGHAAHRIDPGLTYDWGDHAPDPRLASGSFRAVWSGSLAVLTPGDIEFRAHLAGDLKLWLDDKLVLMGRHDAPDWLPAATVAVAFGNHRLRAEYASAAENPQLAVLWQGPGFALEPLPPHGLTHAPHETAVDQRELGTDLWRAARCDACHPSSDGTIPLAAPSLLHISSTASPGRIQELLTGNLRPTSELRHERHWPAFDFTPSQAQDIVDWLFAESRLATLVEYSIPPPGNVAEGQRLFQTVGCLACHRVAGLGAFGLFSGPDLTTIASRRSEFFFRSLLADPASLNQDHRMPRFRLTDDEQNNLVAWLGTLGAPSAESTPGNEQQSDLRSVEQASIRRGKDLATARNCAACHAIPGSDDGHAVPRREPPAPRLGPHTTWRMGGCLGDGASPSQPAYHLTADEISALHASHAQPLLSVVPDALAARMWRERNCGGCHARQEPSNLTSTLAQLVEREPHLAQQLPGLSPPSLAGVGDKYHDEALAAAIRTTSTPLRPWLGIRMPAFPLSTSEVNRLVDWFQSQDQVPAVTPAPLDSGPELLFAGARLVTADGFGCTSCHSIGGVAPRDVALAARGTELAGLASRLRRAWFERFVRNPARIVPRMEMPSIQIPVHGVLDERLDLQLAAVWEALNTQGFTPPEPHPVRVVRQLNSAAEGAKALLLTDVLKWRGNTLKWPLLWAFPNRHNVLFDFETNAMALWWPGDAARQRTEGKSWHWEPGGIPLWSLVSRGELALEFDGQVHWPLAQGQVRFVLDRYSISGGTAEFAGRLMFPDQVGAPFVVEVEHVLGALSADKGHGFERRLTLRGLPPGSQIQWWPVPPLAAEEGRSALQSNEAPASQQTQAPSAQQNPPRIGNPRATPQQPDANQPLVFDGHEDRPWRFQANVQGTATAAFDYLCDIPVDHALEIPSEETALEPVLLDLVPGFSAVRLPIPRDEMPTALAWRADGTLVVASLKGRVLLATDQNSDGEPDHYQAFTPELAAPYGLAVTDGAIDVLDKHALTRFWDDDGDLSADRGQVLAAGWGVTDDYHDWAVGLPRDDAGRYYLALPCQQDERTAEAARWRGWALRLVPRQPTRDDPHAFAVEPFCQGLRFPMGLALDARGRLFASDNQGNYNPFNELNHLEAGRHFGFVNQLEHGQPQSLPITSPAVEIPHPWTRSVNGICFLPPPGSPAGKAYGPWAGHLVGCEYDTRRLVRMSLETVDGVVQGAAYPLSRPAQEGQGLEGPVTCAISPQGELYVGNLRDSGWGGGQNTGSIVRLRPLPGLVPGLAEVRAQADGFVLTFTTDLDSPWLADPANYQLASYRRESTPAYGGDDLERREEIVRDVLVESPRCVHLRLGELRAGYVYELHLGDDVEAGQTLFPAEAHYTLRRIPAAAEIQAQP